MSGQVTVDLEIICLRRRLRFSSASPAAASRSLVSALGARGRGPARRRGFVVVMLSSSKGLERLLQAVRAERSGGTYIHSMRCRQGKGPCNHVTMAERNPVTSMTNTNSGSRRPPKSHRRKRSETDANNGTDLPPTAPAPSSSSVTRQASFVSPIVGRTGAARRHHFRQNSAGSVYSSGGSVVSWGESGRRRRHRSRSRSSSVASNDQNEEQGFSRQEGNAYSPLHTLIPSLHQPPTPMTPASFIVAPEDSETPLDSDVEEQLDGLGLVESLMSLAPDRKSVV